MAGFAGSGVEIGFYLRGGISTQGPKIAIFSGSCCTFLFDFFGPGVKIRKTPRDGILQKRPKLYISIFKLAGLVDLE